MVLFLPTFLAALAIGVPVAFALGVIAVGYIVLSDKVPLNVVPTVIFGGLDSFPLLAIPFFIMTGDLATRCGVLPKMVDFARALIGQTRGGLAHVNIGSSMLFGGVTGVSVADAAAVGGTLIPSMVRDGYSRGFAAAVTAASSVMGAIIPPSVAMLIVAYIWGSGLSVTTLFLSGAIPGMLIGLSMMAYVAIVARRRGFPGGGAGWSLVEIGARFRAAALGLVLPVIVIGGILGGIFTPTEAGAVAAAYALFLGAVVYRNIGLRGFGECLLVSAKMSAMVYLLIGTAKLVAWLLVVNMVPQQFGVWLKPFLGSQEAFLLAVVALFFVLGFFVEGTACMIMLVPIIAPMAKLFAVDPHHLALVIVMTVQIALVTPPMAVGLFVVCPLAGCTIAEVSAEVWPFVLCILGVILAIVFFPGVAMWLPRALGAA